MPTINRTRSPKGSALRYQPTTTTQFVAEARRRRRRFIDQFHQEQANRREDDLHVRQNALRFRERLKAGKTYRAPLADPLADRDIFQEIQRSLAAGDIVRLTGRVGGPVRRRRIPVYRPDWDDAYEEDQRRRAIGIREKTLWVPRWKHAGDKLKALSWAVVMEQDGADAFTLHLSQRVLDAARRDHRGFAYHVQQRIRGQLRKVARRLGIAAPDFFFTVEATSGIEPHVHGAIRFPEGAAAKSAFREALVHAGGFAHVKRTGRELLTRDIYFAAGWVEYVAKWSLQSAEALGGTIFGATNVLRRRGQDWYECARREELIIPGLEQSVFPAGPP